MSQDNKSNSGLMDKFTLKVLSCDKDERFVDLRLRADVLGTFSRCLLASHPDQRDHAAAVACGHELQKAAQVAFGHVEITEDLNVADRVIAPDGEVWDFVNNDDDDDNDAEDDGVVVNDFSDCDECESDHAVQALALHGG